MQKEINGKTYNIKELSYLQAIEIEDTKTKSGITEASKKMIEFSTGLSDTEIQSLSLKDGKELQKAINDLNDLSFQNPTTE